MSAQHSPADQAYREYRRAYNREYMRAWRTRAENARQERMRKKLQRPARNPRNYCQWCDRAARTQVRRKSILESGRFVEILVPYCGEC